jgi:hypothetical protein
MLTDLAVDLLNHFHEFADEAERRAVTERKKPYAPDYFAGMSGGMAAAILHLHFIIISNPDDETSLLFALQNILPAWHLHATEEYEETIQAAARVQATGEFADDVNPYHTLGEMAAYDYAHKSLSKVLDFCEPSRRTSKFPN